jgi:hypothetical protein
MPNRPLPTLAGAALSPATECVGGFVGGGKLVKHACSWHSTTWSLISGQISTFRVAGWERQKGGSYNSPLSRGGAELELSKSNPLEVPSWLK